MSSDPKVKLQTIFTVVAELADTSFCITQNLAQHTHFTSGVQSLLPILSYALPRLMVNHNEN